MMLINNKMTLLSMIIAALSLSACNQNDQDNLAIPSVPETTINTISNVGIIAVGKTANFIIQGNNLDNKIQVAAKNCTNLQINQQSLAKIDVSCVVAAADSVQIDIVKAKQIVLTKNFATVVQTTGLLNDTGINFCATDLLIESNCQSAQLGEWANLPQDAYEGRDALAEQKQLTKIGLGEAGFDFTKIGSKGERLAITAKQWSCVLDNHTGLLWEAKTADAGLHDYNNRYTWYNPDTTINGNNVGLENDGKNTLVYVQTVNQQALCGYKDWRLPTQEQLQSIVNYGRHDPAIDSNYFPYTQSDAYWTSESLANSILVAGVNFNYGTLENLYKNHRFSQIENFVRLVRSTD